MIFAIAWKLAGLPAVVLCGWTSAKWTEIDQRACRLPIWLVVFCRLHVPLQEGQPCVQNQARRLQRMPARPPAPTVSDDKKDGDGLVGAPTTTSDAWLGPTIAGLDALDAEDKQGFVEESARSPSLILNILHLNLQSATLMQLHQAHFTPCHHLWYHTWCHTWFHIWYGYQQYWLWNHRAMISYNLDIIDAGPWYHMWYHTWYQYRYQRYLLWYHRAMISYNLDIIDAEIWYHTWYHKWYQSRLLLY
jgi:hypothetical protein